MLEANSFFLRCWCLHKVSSSIPFGAISPMWYLRLSHTRLADSILELCGIPQKDTARRACFTILSQLTAPGPSSLAKFVKKGKKRVMNRTDSDSNEILEAQLSDAVNKHGVPMSAAENLRTFITKGCMPLPCDIDEALDKIQTSVFHLRRLDNDSGRNSRRMKRFEDVAKSLRSLRNLVGCLRTLGIAPLFGQGKGHGGTGRLNIPLYISLDLGLRQRRKHYHGQSIYQCIVLPDTYFDCVGDSIEHNDFVLSAAGHGTKIAEGGRFDDLVSRCAILELALDDP